MPVTAPGCRGKMENYFREKKHFRARRKRKDRSGPLTPATDTSSSSAEQSPMTVRQLRSRSVCEESGVAEQHHQKIYLELDRRLKVGGKRDTSRRTYWLPESPYTLGGCEEYVPVRQMVVTAPRAAVQDEDGGWSLQLSPLRNLCSTSLKVWVPGYPLEGVLFTATKPSEEEDGALQLDFQAVMDYMRNFFETGIHLLEVAQGKTRATTRFVVGSWKDPRMPPDLPFYTPRTHGGPFFRNRYGNYSILKTVRSYRSAQRLPHDLEFFVSLSGEQKTRLEEMCKQA